MATKANSTGRIETREAKRKIFDVRLVTKLTDKERAVEKNKETAGRS